MRGETNTRRLGKRNGLRKGEGDVTIQRHSRNTKEFKISADSRQSQTRKKKKHRDSQVQKDKRTTNNREPCIVERHREQLLRNKGGKTQDSMDGEREHGTKKNG